MKYIFMLCCVIVVASCTREPLGIDELPIEVSALTLHTSQNSSPKLCSSEEQAVSEEAYENYEKMLRIFKLTQEKSLQNATYPNFYGGVYVDDRERLVIQIKDKSTSDAISFMKQFSNVVYNDCNYSYNELLDVIATIEKKSTLDKDLSQNIGMYCIDDKNNIVNVYFYSLSDEIISRFKRVITDFPGIIFGEISNVENHSLKCGDMFKEVSDDSTMYRGSIGYRAMDSDGYEGFVTAGHCIAQDVGVRDSLNSIQIGYCSDSRYDDGYVDAAFCVISNPDYLVSNRIRYMTNPSVDTLHTDLSQSPVNIYVNMIGYSSGQRRSGKVVKSSITLQKNGVIILRDAIAAYYKSQGGDSGGLVYSYVS